MFRCARDYVKLIILRRADSGQSAHKVQVKQGHIGRISGMTQPFTTHHSQPLFPPEHFYRNGIYNNAPNEQHAYIFPGAPDSGAFVGNGPHGIVEAGEWQEPANLL